MYVAVWFFTDFAIFGEFLTKNAEAWLFQIFSCEISFSWEILMTSLALLFYHVFGSETRYFYHILFFTVWSWNRRKREGPLATSYLFFSMRHVRYIIDMNKYNWKFGFRSAFVSVSSVRLCVSQVRRPMTPCGLEFLHLGLGFAIFLDITKKFDLLRRSGRF